MKCVTPMFRRYEKANYEKGTIISRQEALNILTKEDPNYYQAIKKINNKDPYYGYEMIPCKNCWACQLNYSAEWATKIMCEVQESEHNYFITLTYDDKHLPKAKEGLVYEKKINVPGQEPRYEKIYYDYQDWWTGTLQPHDTEVFLNSLRKYFERKGHKGIKYYYCGEYGEKTQRPHYHFILMNVPLDISQFYGTYVDKNFKAHWKSYELEKWWDKGMIDIAEVEWSSAAYVARYCMKKLYKPKDKEEYYINGKIPEFTRMSRRPGIGTRYYERNKEKIYNHDEMIGKTVKGNVGSYKPPKAWDQRYKKEFPNEWKLIKKSRQKAAERAERIQKELSDYTDLEKQNIATRKILEKNSMLPRPGEW